MMAILIVDINPLIASAVHLGGHIKMGLKDVPLISERGYVWRVKDALKQINAAGRELALATDVCANLKENFCG